MTASKTPVTEMFAEMVKAGYVSPVTQMEEMRLPGEFAFVPSLTSYGVPDVPIAAGIHQQNAKLEQRSKRD